MSLISGQIIDMCGLPFIFIGFAALQAVNIVIVIVWLPPPKRRQEGSEHNGETQSCGSFLKLLSRFDIIWFFINLLQYGLAMSLVENFLLVFLLQDFNNTPKILLGASVAMMCAFEVPVFKYIGSTWSRYRISLTTILIVCQAVLVSRCLLYTLLPASQPWLVLLIEPLHGVTFA